MNNHTFIMFRVRFIEKAIPTVKDTSGLELFNCMNILEDCFKMLKFLSGDPAYSTKTEHFGATGHVKMIEQANIQIDSVESDLGIIQGAKLQAVINRLVGDVNRLVADPLARDSVLDKMADNLIAIIAPNSSTINLSELKELEVNMKKLMAAPPPVTPRIENCEFELQYAAGSKRIVVPKSTTIEYE